MKRVNVNVDKMQVFVMINKGGMKINTGVNVKNRLIKVHVFGILIIVSVNVINRLILASILDYQNCKCRKKLVDKLVEECTENVEEVKLAKITLAENENKY